MSTEDRQLDRPDAQGEAELNLECLRSAVQSSRAITQRAVGIIRLVESGKKSPSFLRAALEQLELADRQVGSELDRIAREEHHRFSMRQRFGW